jgi:GT2 family glycosyltransferase
VVDNCSPNGDADKIEGISTEDTFHFVRAPENLGFAAGCNIGINYAQKIGATHVGLINPDTVFTFDDTLTQIDEAFLSSTYDIIGTYILSAATQKIEFGGAKILPILFYPKVKNHDMPYQTKSNTLNIDSTDYTTGSSLFFPLALYDKIGTIDESYFLYFEETDWCLRARKYGYTIGIISSTALEHKTSQSVGFRSRLYTKYMIRNYARFALRYARWYEIPPWSLLYI